MSHFFEDLLQTINLCGALWLSNTLQVEVGQSIGNCKVDDFALPRLIGGVVEAKAELFVFFQEHLVPDDIIERLS